MSGSDAYIDMLYSTNRKDVLEAIFQTKVIMNTSGSIDKGYDVILNGGGELPMSILSWTSNYLKTSYHTCCQPVVMGVQILLIQSVCLVISNKLATFTKATLQNLMLGGFKFLMV